MTPYATSLAAEIAARDREQRAVRAYGSRAVDPLGSRAREILALLARGPVVLHALAIEVDLPDRILLAYAQALAPRGVCVTHKSGIPGRHPKRQVTILALAESPV